MKDELHGGYIAHYFERDQQGNFGNEAILPPGGKLTGLNGVVEIQPDNMPAEIPLSGDRKMVLGAFKDKDGKVVQVPEIVAALDQRRNRQREESSAIARRMLEKLDGPAESAALPLPGGSTETEPSATQAFSR